MSLDDAIDELVARIKQERVIRRMTIDVKIDLAQPDEPEQEPDIMSRLPPIMGAPKDE